MKVTDNIGKDFPKIETPKRGRPRLMDPLEAHNWRTNVRDGEPGTLRTIQNWHYYGQAALALCDGQTKSVPPECAKRFGWLLRLDETGGRICARKSILFQLGRTRCPIALKIFAEDLCRLKPTATEAVTLIRCWQSRRDGLAALYLAEGGRDFSRKRRETIAREATAKRRA